MIPKSCRLSYNDILLLKKSSIKTRIDWVLIMSTQAPDGESAKIGVVVSKKIAKSSVVRHRIKRILLDEMYPMAINSNKYILISVQTMPEGCGSLRTVAERRIFRATIAQIITRFNK